MKITGKVVALFMLAVVVFTASGLLFAQQSKGGAVSQVIALATSQEAVYSDPSGAMQSMPGTSLTFDVPKTSLLTVFFSARGSVEPSGSQVVPIVFIDCQIDGQPCQPDSNPVEFLYPQFCCDTRSFQWIVSDVAAGSHNVRILWGMGNPTSAAVTNRSLTVQVAKTTKCLWQLDLAPSRPFHSAPPIAQESFPLSLLMSNRQCIPY